MTAVAHGTDPVRRRVSAVWSTSAAVLLLGSGALQLVASLQRWVGFRDSRAPDDISAEDHLYDYSYPSDPWVPIGTAAQLFGLGCLLLAVGVLVMLAAAPRRRIPAMLLPAVVAAGSFALDGAHALSSGLAGVPSPVQHWLDAQWFISLIGFCCLVVLGVLWLRTSRAVAAACLLLLGSTVPGYLVATFGIAPALAGYQSHDTTPWTETIVAVSAAFAGIAMLVAAVSGRATSRRPRV